MDLLVAQLELAQVRVDSLAHGLELKSASGFVDWRNYSALLARSAEVLGGVTELDEACAATFGTALPEGAHLMTLAGEPMAGMELMNAFADASFFTHIRHTIRRTGSRSFHVITRAAERQLGGDSRAFFHGVAGNLRAAALFAGLPPATVRATVRAQRADYEVILPPAARVDSGATLVRAQRSFVAQCSRELVRARTTMLETQRTASLAAVSATYAALSAATAAALEGQQRELMPSAAVRAIARSLGCERVAICHISSANGKRSQLAAIGHPQRRVVSVEHETADGALVIQASVARSSRELAALQQLGPWLALVFAEPPPRESARKDDWQQARLAELAKRWRLTPRQRQVALLIALGETNKGIAAKLQCAEGTVELHAHAVLHKAQLPTRAALAAYFFGGG